MADNTRNISSTVGTIPQGTSMSGKVTTNASDSTKLDYTAGNNTELAALINDGNDNWGGYTYLYAPDGTPKIRRLLGFAQLTSTTATITLDAAMTGLSSDSFQIINTPLYGYSYLNNGGSNGSVDGVVVKDGEGVSIPPSDVDSGIGELKTPVYVDASATNFSIIETTH